MTSLVHPSLVVQIFAPLGATEAATAANRDHLAAVWSAAATRLEMTERLLESVPQDVAEWPDGAVPDFRLLAGRSSDGSNGVAQAYVFARHDVLGVCAALASSGESEPWARWAELSARWDDAVRDGTPPDSLLGESRLFVGHVASGSDLVPLGDEVHGALAAAGFGAWEPPYVTSDGVVLWSWGRGERDQRVTSILSGTELEAAVSRWLWWQGDREAARFLLYQLNAAKLDYETHVHRGRRQKMMAALADVDQDMDAVQRLHASVALAGRASMGGLIDAQERLIASQAASSAVVIQTTYLLALRRTITIARRNLAGLVPPAGPSQPGDADSGFLRDQAQAGWLEDQIEHDLGYAEAVLARSREAQGLTLLRLQQLSTRIARAQSRITLLQTSILGALGAGLGWLALVRLPFDPPADVRLPLLLAFVTLLLAAPALAAHWFERFGIVDHIAAVLFGAALGWLVMVLLLDASNPVLELVGALLGAIAARAFTLLHDRAPLPGNQRGAAR